MQTTLRINDALYREAKAEAARQGVTLTRFLEEAVRLRLGHGLGNARAKLPVYDSGRPVNLSLEQLLQISRKSQEEQDLAKVSSPTFKN